MSRRFGKGWAWPQNQQDELRALEPSYRRKKTAGFAALTREKIKKMLAVLTPEQRSQLREETVAGQTARDGLLQLFLIPMLPSPFCPIAERPRHWGSARNNAMAYAQIVTAHWMTLIALQHQQQRLPLGDEKAFKAIGEKQRQEMANLRKQIEACSRPPQWALCKEMAFENMAMNWLRWSRSWTMASLRS